MRRPGHRGNWPAEPIDESLADLVEIESGRTGHRHRLAEGDEVGRLESVEHQLELRTAADGTEVPDGRRDGVEDIGDRRQGGLVAAGEHDERPILGAGASAGHRHVEERTGRRPACFGEFGNPARRERRRGHERRRLRRPGDDALVAEPHRSRRGVVGCRLEHDVGATSRIGGGRRQRRTGADDFGGVLGGAVPNGDLVAVA